MKIQQLLSLLTESFDSSQVYLHGGPSELKNNHFKRGGRNGHDMGALFFVPENEDGYKYAMGYAISRSPRNWAIYRVKINLNKNQIFDFTNPQHKKIAYQNLNPEEYKSWEQSKGSSGHLDWTKVDEEILEEWNFQGAVFHERAKEILNTNKDIVSIGIFNPSPIQIIEKLTKEDFKN